MDDINLDFNLKKLENQKRKSGIPNSNNNNCSVLLWGCSVHCLNTYTSIILAIDSQHLLSINCQLANKHNLIVECVADLYHTIEYH